VSGEKTPPVRDTALLLGWVGGIILAGCLLWLLTQPGRGRNLARGVNRAMVLLEKDYHLGNPLPFGDMSPAAARLGFWFTLQGEENRERKVLVFTLIAGGSFLPCAAVVSPDGKMEELIPLRRGGEALLKGLSPGETALWVRRIEGGYHGGL
jgi:hypothetical protein